MSLKRSTGQMYPWITHQHTHLGGECPHRCIYCYVSGFRKRSAKYQGELRLIEEEFKVYYGAGKTIFIEHCNDLFAAAVPERFIWRILNHCKWWPWNTYVFQTKNPARYKDFLNWLPPRGCILGITIETNRIIQGISKAPSPEDRFKAFAAVELEPYHKFITIEPVLDFDVGILAQWIEWIRPEFINLGADSKNHNLPEPSVEKIEALIAELKKHGIELREKHNLQRLRRTE
jgi:DNA repair photolyase